MSEDKWNPEQYHRFQRERSQPFYDLLSMVQVNPSMNIVDLGCGTGELTSILHRHLKAKFTLGVDHSPSMLKKAESFNSSDVRFQRNDIENFTELEAYDLIFSNAALQWCDGHPALLKRLKDALKKNGQLAVQIPANHDYPTHVLASRLAATPKWKERLKGFVRHSPVLTPQEYAQILFDLGFEQQHVHLQVYGHVLNSREDVLEWVKGALLIAYESVLTPGHYTEFIEELKEALFEMLPDTKPFFYPFKRILFWGSLKTH